jgi:hypothetical protein
MASATWAVPIPFEPSRSAIVRATFKIRTKARAERPSRSMAFEQAKRFRDG